MADLILLAQCFQYSDPSTGDQVTTLPINNYVSLIGKRVCSLVTTVSTYQQATTQLAGRVTSLEAQFNNLQPYTLPSLYPKYIASPTTALVLNDFTALLEKQFGELRLATGNVNDISDSLAAFTALNSLPSVGTSGGNLSALPSWISQVAKMPQGITNLLVMVKDLRSAVTNLQLNFGSNLCNSVEIAMSGTFSNRILTLFFTGTIPSELVNTESGGVLFRIEDQSGGFLNSRVDIKGNLNNTAGISLDLTGANLNFADDLSISGVNSLTNPLSGTTCQKFLELDIVNNSACPTVTISAGYTSLSYSFNHTVGTLTYSTQLYSVNNVQLQAFNTGVSGPITVTGQFTGLTPGTTYKIRVQMITPEITRSCPFAMVDTLPAVCPAPNGVSAEIIIE